MPMFVGACRVELDLEGNDSLKGKRSVVKSIIQRVRNQFNASVAEVDCNDEHGRAVIGLTLVGNDKRFVNACIDKIQDFIDREADAPVADFQFSIEQYD